MLSAFIVFSKLCLHNWLKLSQLYNINIIIATCMHFGAVLETFCIDSSKSIIAWFNLIADYSSEGHVCSSYQHKVMATLFCFYGTTKDVLIYLQSNTCMHSSYLYSIDIAISVHIIIMGHMWISLRLYSCACVD